MARVRALLACVSCACVLPAGEAFVAVEAFALVVLRAAFLAFAGFAPALVLRGEVVGAVGIWRESPSSSPCEEVRVCSLGPRYPNWRDRTPVCNPSLEVCYKRRVPCRKDPVLTGCYRG